MVTAIIGGLIGWGIGAAAGLTMTTAFTIWQAVMIGMSLGSLVGGLIQQNNANYDSSPTYSFGQISNTMSQNLPIPVIYGGEMRVAGNIIYQAYDSDEKKVQTLYVLLSEGEIENVRDVMANDQLVTDLPDCSLTIYKTTAANTHDSRDPSGTRPYPDNVAMLCMTLTASEKLNSQPTITSIVKGVKVWTPNGKVWSTNPIWCAIDLLANPRYGLGMCTYSNGAYDHPDWDKIDYTAAVTAANYCDGYVDGEKRFELTYVLDTQKPIKDVLNEMLSTCRGYMVETDKIQFHIDAPVNNYTREITTAHIVEGTFTWWQKTSEDMFNQFTVDWVDPNSSYDRVTDVFQDSNDIADRGIVTSSVQLVGITRQSQVERMGYYLLKTSLLVRNLCSFNVGIKDCDILPGEVIAITYAEFTGWNKKWFRVISTKVVSETEMTVVCGEYISDCYNDSSIAVVAHIDTQRTLTVANVTGLTITDSVDTTLSLFATISWTAQTSINGYELSYRFNNTGNWIGIGSLSQGVSEYRLNCDGHNNDTLTVRVVTVSTLGRRSSGVTASKTLNAQPPANVTGLQAVQDGNSLDLFWDANNESNFRFYEIRKGNIWDISQLIARTTDNYYAIPCSVAGTYSYLVKAVDANGVYSVNAANTIISISGSQLLPTNVYVDYDAITLFNEGTADGIRLISNPSTWATISETWNEVTRTWDEFGAEYIVTLNTDATDGTYVSAVKDLAKVISADLAFTISYYMTLGDTVTLEIRTSTDNITWTGWQPADNRLQKFRYIQWRFIMHAADVTNQPYITQFKLRIDMPDVQKTGRATIPVGGGQISFGYTFAIKPTIVLTAEGADKQAFYNATDLDYSSVVATVKDTDGTDTGGNINWIALGY